MITGGLSIFIPMYMASVNVLKKKTKSQNVIVQASIETGKWMAKNMLFIKIEEQEGLVSVEEL